MTKKQKWFVGFMAALLLTVGIATQVSARDMKSYPPSMCDAVGTGDMRHSSSYSYMSSAGTAICPVIKDRWGSDLWQWGGVHVYDTNSSANISCTLYARNQSGGATDWETNSTSGTPGNVRLEFDVTTGTASSTATYSYYCTFGAGATNLSIKSYFLSEFNDED